MNNKKKMFKKKPSRPKKQIRKKIPEQIKQVYSGLAPSASISISPNPAFP